jgi:uncharacterized lipoprotein YajG
MGGPSLKKIALVLLCCLLIPWSVEAEEKVIDLQYKPKEKVKVHLKNAPTVKIFFEEVKDTRSQPREIGENQEDKENKIKIVTPKDDGARHFVLLVLKKEFRNKGFKVENKPDKAQKIIIATLLKFWTVEESRYNSETLLEVELRDKIGEGSFKKTYSGTGTNFGRSLSEENYNESFSDAIARIVETVFSDSEFLKVLSEKPKPPRVEKKVDEKNAEEKRLEEKRDREKRLDEIRLELKRLEETRLEEKKAKEIRVKEKRIKEIRLELKRLKEIRLEEKRAKEKKRVEERKRIEEKRAKDKRLKETRLEEKIAEEIKKAEEKKREEEKRAEEIKKAEEIKAEEIKKAEEKKREEEKRAKKRRIKEKRAKEKQEPTPAKPNLEDPVFGPI